MAQAAKIVAAYEAKSGSNHSSPNSTTRVVPLHGTAKKEAQNFMLVSFFFFMKGINERPHLRQRSKQSE